ncbi:MAG: VOC family protein, partial [Ktedonobacteraceae bacterium]
LRETMTGKSIREGFHAITPYLMVRQAAELADFVKEAFDATELFRATGSAGGLHIEVRIGDSMLMIGAGGTWSGEPMPAALYLYMDDVDEVYKRRLKAGATSIMKPADQPHGDRLAGVKDAFGNVWYISTHVQDVPMS